MHRRIILTLLAMTVLVTSSAQSHHSFTAVYDADSEIEMEGKVVQFLFRNPHSVLHVLVQDEDGNEVRWAAEWQGATQLGSMGISAQSIRAGDPVKIVGHPGRVEAEHRLLLLEIRRTTDGFGWSNGQGRGGN